MRTFPRGRAVHRVAVAIAAAGLLAGCSGTTTAASAPPSGAASPGTASSSAATGSTAAASTPATVAAAGTAGGGAGAVARCTLQEVSASLASPRGDGSQRTVALVWTNVSTRPCTMTGFGGVDLVGPADPNGTTYSLPRSDRQPSTVRLVPGATARTEITYLAPDAGSVGSNGSRNWTPTSAVVTPPDETHHETLAWTAGPVERQDGATHPGTFIGPVSAG